MLATALVGVHPNPFNPRTEIRFDLARAGTVDLQIYNLRGQLVRTMVHENMPAGHHVRIWQGDDDRGQSVASGVYVVLMQVDHQSFRKKLTLLR